jgi:hypothetical protein
MYRVLLDLFFFASHFKTADSTIYNYLKKNFNRSNDVFRFFEKGFIVIYEMDVFAIKLEMLKEKKFRKTKAIYHFSFFSDKIVKCAFVFEMKNP